MWYVYILRCYKGAYYTGITTNVTRRLAQHNAGKGSKAVKALGLPVVLVWYAVVETKSAALKMEHRIKQLSAADKRRIVVDGAILDDL
jgi:putative endonuclease